MLDNETIITGKAIARPSRGLEIGSCPDQDEKGATRAIKDETSVRASRVVAPSLQDEAVLPYLESAYEFGLRYKSPPASHKVSIIDGYICDSKPTDFDETYQAREDTGTVHEAVFKCSVSGDFIDDSVFTDTNILLEILQNAEPNDSKGTWFALEFYADGKWRSVVEEIRNFSDEQIKVVRISDNGRGYLPTDMTTIGGGKRSDPRSAGRFGTGMKVSDRSALGKNVQILRYSRNWRANPYLEPILTSAGHNHTVSYKVDFFPDCIGGSVVEYSNLTPAMLAALRQIQDLYLPLDTTLKERILAQTDSGLILSPKTHQGSIIMVKGRIYTLRVPTENPLLFSYDLHNCVIDDQNRHYVGTSEATENVRHIWSSVSDPKLFCRLFDEAEKNTTWHEHTMPGLDNVPESFKQAAITFYGIKNLETTFINDSETTEEDQKLLTRQGYQGIKVQTKARFIAETLEQVGILTGRRLMESISESRFHKPSDELENENFASCVCRAVATVEKLGKGARNILIFFQEEGDKEERQLSYNDFLQAVKAGRRLNPTRFLVCLDHNHLAEMPRQEKKEYKFKWRNYFDDIADSAIASGVDMSIRTDIFELVPRKEGSGSYGHVYVFTWEKLPEQPLGITIYINSAYEAGQLRKLHEYSLNLDPNYQPVEKTEHGDIVRLDNGLIYEQGIKKNENNSPETPRKSQRILSYNLPERVTEGCIDATIAQIVQQTNKPEVAIAILKKAKEEDKETYFAEYLSDDNLPINKGVWKSAFETIFGNDIVVDDMEAHEMKDLALSVKDSSKINRVRLNPKLVAVLCSCGVKTLSQAVTAKEVVGYKPTPVQEALLEVAILADEAIKLTLPKGAALMPTRIRAVKSVQNTYCQEIKSGSGYMDPLLRDLTIYVSDQIVHPKKIEQLFSFILRKKIDAYRKTMSANDHAEFKAQTIAVADACMMQSKFYRRVASMMYDREKKIPQLITETLDLMQRSPTHDEEEFDLIPGKTGGYRRLPSLRKIQIEISARVKTIVEAIRKLTQKIKLPKKKPQKRKPSPSSSSSMPRKTVLALTTVVGTLAVGVLIAHYTPNNLREKFRNSIAEVIGAISPDPDGYQRPDLLKRSRIGVNIDRNRISGDDFDNPSEYIGHQLNTFVSAPALEWGDFMAEQAQTIYDGKGWMHDENAPDFDNPNYPKVRRIAHYQVLGDQREVSLRTRAGGYIDPASIKVLKKDGSHTTGFRTEKQHNREYSVIITDDEARAIMYSTVSPINWQQTAEKLTDADFAKLPQDIYAYYTAKPDIDPGKVRFSSPLYPEFSTLEQFLSFLKSQTPFERLKILRNVVGKMRYTRTERTEHAYAQFHKGNLPEKDFLEFALNSNELEQPGDGDCDAQNTVFAVMARLAGIPAKLDFVITENGVGHGPASVYLPNVGWILMDTMGERVLIEEINFGANELPYNERIQLSPEMAEQALIERLRRQQEWQKRRCYELQE